MANVFAVIGNARMRKTSSIRALTGVGKVSPRWNVAYTHGNASTYVQPPGLQETHIPPETFIQTVNGAGVECVIVALRYSEVGHGGQIFPNAAAYLAAFQRANWNISGHAVLGPGDPLPGGGVTIQITNPDDMASNAIAARLRQTWGII
jgi:hypothetical protein